jgi:two-component system, OmpR family, sensor histidine kinase VicK
VPAFLAALKGRAETLARGHGASFEAHLSGEGYLRADPARIEQAVLILVDNAAKYSPAGERVTLTAKTESGELLIRVEDRGPGIPEEHLPHIFERFFRDDKARARKQGGAGLGLSIARTIAQAHGGRIEAESHVGEGTKMSLHLPLDGEPKQSVRTANRDAHDGRTQERDRA